MGVISWLEVGDRGRLVLNMDIPHVWSVTAREECSCHCAGLGATSTLVTLYKGWFEIWAARYHP